MILVQPYVLPSLPIATVTLCNFSSGYWHTMCSLPLLCACHVTYSHVMVLTGTRLQDKNTSTTRSSGCTEQV